MQRLFPSALLRALVPSLVVLGSSGSAYADEQPSADLRGTYAPLHHEAGMGMESVKSPGTGEMTASVRLSYAFRPVVLRRSPTPGETEAEDSGILHSIIEHQFTGDFMVSVGLVERVTLGVDLPVVLGQTGDEIGLEDPAADFVGTEPPPLTAIGDIGLRAKVTIVQPDVDDLGLSTGFGLAVDDRFTAPTGDERSFIGEGGIANEARIIGELAYGPIWGSLRAGVKVRGDTGHYACDPELPEDQCVTRFGHELPLGLGLALRPQALGVDPDGIVTIFAETRAYLPIDPVRPTESTAPAGWFASLAGRFAFGDVALLAGVELGLLDGVGNAPFRGTLGVSVAPRAPDQDRDGFPDEEDKCPTFAEDRDTFEDTDGCPEMDNDGDGVPDALDKCPAAPGKGGDDGDGCPEA
jgi:hypothetical protein